MTADTPASMDYLLRIFTEDEKIGREEINVVLEELQAECETRGVELKEVASGYRYQAKQALSQWLARLDTERPSRYSRALLETLSLVVYRQPVTRAEIEDVRGVAVSSSIIKTLLEREWVRVVGHRDVPGKPALYGTTRQFLDYFNLKSLSELPPLAEIRSLDSIQSELELELEGIAAAGEAANDADAMNDEQSVAEGGEEVAGDVDTTEVAVAKTDQKQLGVAADASGTDKGDAESSQDQVSDVVSEATVVEEEHSESVAVETAAPETEITPLDDEAKGDEAPPAVKAG